MPPKIWDTSLAAHYQDNKKSHPGVEWLFLIKMKYVIGESLTKDDVRDVEVYRLPTMLLKTLPTTGPSRRRMAITTMATRTRINAYSTRP
jgi:hypothetical protein